LQFDLSRDIDSAAVDVQSAISAVTPLLPPGMPNPPSFRKTNPAEQPIINLVLTSSTFPMNQLDEYAETLIAQRISMVSGVAQVSVQGGQKYAVRVQLDPDKLVAKRIGLNEVRAALQSWNVNTPTGTLFGPQQAYNIQANGQLMNATEFKTLIVAWRNGAPVRLGEVANVIDDVENNKNIAYRYTEEGRERAIILQVMRQPGSNTVAVTDAVTTLLPMFEKQLPPSVHLITRGDRAKTIRQAFQDIQYTMVITLVLVIGVIFLFLRNASATVIPSLALPFAILGTFAVMAVLHYSLDNMSLMALILSIGFVVDDAIVMLENTVRHIEHGEKPFEAALRGSKEVGFTIVSMTISLAAVFIPVLFMGGVLGRLFREFAVTITTAVLISGLVSITFTPMLCSRFLKIKPPGTGGWLSRAAEWPFDLMSRFYGASLRTVLKYRAVMGVVFFIVLGATIYLFGNVSKGFIPEQDMDQLQMNLIAAQGTSYYQMQDYQKRVADIVRQDPDVESIFSNPGGGNRANMFVVLRPLRERAAGAAQIIQRLRPKISRFPGFQVTLSMPPSLRIGGRQSSSTYQIEVRAPDTNELYTQAQILEKAIANEPHVLEVTTDLEMKSPRVTVDIDRERAALYDLNANQIEQALYDGYGPSIASTIYKPANQYRVMLEMQPRYQTFPDYISKIYFKAGNGQLVPLNSLARIVPAVGPQSIAHSGQLPAVTISFNLKPGVSLGDAVESIQQLAKDTLPPGVTARFAGTAQAFQDSLKNLALLLTVAILVVYIVLGVLYESYIHPLTILSGLPSAGVGALLTLILFKSELNIYSFVGLMMLIGIVKKNAIMQIDFALEAERKDGLPPREAIYQGCLIRFRPIMMTTMAALLGSLPIAFGYGAGGAARRPLGLAVVGGLIVSQLMTLYLTPVVYTYMASLLNWRRERVPVNMGTPAP
ncbi:MAG TPA: efflux RND transporter permease subunit, partial [Bryobacteraceae bacterium]